MNRSTWNTGGTELAGVVLHSDRTSRCCGLQSFGVKGSATVGLSLALSLVLSMAPALGQLDPPLGTTLVGQWDGFAAGLYSDVWADGNYAYIGHFGSSGLDIIDISNPAAPVKVSEVLPAAPNQGASSQDHQVHNGMLFIALESNDNDGVLIVDVRNPLIPIQKTLITILPPFDDVHNVSYVDGILYLANSRTTDIAAVDLTGYDLDAAPATITTPLWLWNYGSSFVHDITVKHFPLRNQTLLFACGWNSGVGVYDVTNILTSPPVFLASAPGFSTHSAWPTDDGRFITTGEERGGGGIKNYEIIDLIGGGMSLVLRDEFTVSTTRAFSVHNQLTVGYRLYNAWYQAGLMVFDINPVTGELDLIASRDTFAGAVSGFDGAWGVYPFLGQDKVLVSDLQTGLYIFDVTGQASIQIPANFPSNVHPVLPTTATIRVVDPGLVVIPSTVTMHSTIVGDAPQSAVMSAVGGGFYEADLPPVACADEIEFYFTAQTTSAETISYPINAPSGQLTRTPQTNVIEAYRDDLETNLGWVVGAIGDNATAGIWTLVDPVGTIAQPEDDDTAGAGTQCFVTGQGAVGGAAGTADIDGGRTTLTSPAFSGLLLDDLSVGYSRWYSNDLGGAPNADSMTVQLSNDGGASWINLETVTENANAWVRKNFRIAAAIPPTANMKLRFVASDLASASLVEAGVDELVLETFLCNQPYGDRDGDGDVDLADYPNFQQCLLGPQTPRATGCLKFDVDLDNDVDMDDYLAVHLAFSGPS